MNVVPLAVKQAATHRSTLFMRRLMVNWISPCQTVSSVMRRSSTVLVRFSPEGWEIAVDVWSGIRLLEQSNRGSLHQHLNHRHNNFIDVPLRCQFTGNVTKSSPLPKHYPTSNHYADVRLHDALRYELRSGVYLDATRSVQVHYYCKTKSGIHRRASSWTVTVPLVGRVVIVTTPSQPRSPVSSA